MGVPDGRPQTMLMSNVSSGGNVNLGQTQEGLKTSQLLCPLDMLQAWTQERWLPVARTAGFEWWDLSGAELGFHDHTTTGHGPRGRFLLQPPGTVVLFLGTSPKRSIILRRFGGVLKERPHNQNPLGTWFPVHLVRDGPSKSNQFMTTMKMTHHGSMIRNSVDIGFTMAKQLINSLDKNIKSLRVLNRQVA